MIDSENNLHPLTAALYRSILRLRPAQVGDWVKTLCRIQRRWLTLNDGHHFFIDPVSLFGQALINERHYEPGLSSLVKLVMQTGGVFVDVGANEGYFSVLAATANPKNQVIAVEPQSRLQAVIKKNFDKNNLGDVTIKAAAITDSTEPVTLFLRPTTLNGSSSMFNHWKLGKRSETVPGIPLDQLLDKQGAERVRLMKIDCEGAEHLVIRGCLKSLQAHRVDLIALEYHRTIIANTDIESTHSALTSAGYQHLELPFTTLYFLPEQESFVDTIQASL